MAAKRRWRSWRVRAGGGGGGKCVRDERDGDPGSGMIERGKGGGLRGEEERTEGGEKKEVGARFKGE